MRALSKDEHKLFKTSDTVNLGICIPHGKKDDNTTVSAIGFDSILLNSIERISILLGLLSPM